MTQDLIASMLIGHTHTLLSRSLYSKIRAILSLLNIQLPAWATVCTSKARIHDLLGFKLILNLLVFGTPCYSLSVKKIVSQVCHVKISFATPHFSTEIVVETCRSLPILLLINIQIFIRK
jgi:hypothetical protein